jgi:hypothetical protein
MEFLNDTPCPARLLRTVIDRTRIAAAVVARATYDFASGALVCSPEQPWKVSVEPWSSPAGLMDGDVPFRKGGVDVHVFGTAHAPGGRPTPSFEVRVEVGDLVRRARVWGERMWTARGEDVVPSAPQPIASLPLAMEHAYGGEADFDGLRVQNADNPKGKGFHLEREKAAGAPLPQIEDADACMGAWDDRPEPLGFGFCPFPSAARLRAAVVVDDGVLEKITHRLYNTAFPAMVTPSAAPGTLIRLEGVSPDGPIVLAVPSHRLCARIEVGDRAIERPLEVDQIGIEVDVRRAFFGYRFPFRYVLRPEELRRATLFEKKGG